MSTNIRNIIPEHFLSCGLDHFSPSQATSPVDIWVYKYLYCSSKDRSKFEGSSRMHCGKEVGIAVEDWYPTWFHKPDLGSSILSLATSKPLILLNKLGFRPPL